MLGNNGLVGRRSNLTGRSDRRRGDLCTAHYTPSDNQQYYTRL